MFYYLHLFGDAFSPLRVFRYITVRAFCGAGTAFLLTLWLGPAVIAGLRRLNVSQYVRHEEAPPLYALHGHKEGTPTMGGVLIVAVMALSALLWGALENVLLWIALATTVYMALIGLWDDYRKVVGKDAKGLRARNKFALQVLWALVLTAMLHSMPETRERVRQLMAPFFKEPAVRDLGVAGTALFVAAVVVGATNAVNLTDGLDGLAIGCTGSAALAYLVMAYAAGHAAFASYLLIPYVRGAGELAVFCGCLLGASLGFLWYNCHPAQVFMGDTGSLALGGAIAAVAVLIKQELVLVIVGGVFVIEALSVIVQVVCFKTRGRRVFAMAPLHHHFEIKKWSETQVVVRFWILAIIFALLGILTLKIR